MSRVTRLALRAIVGLAAVGSVLMWSANDNDAITVPPANQVGLVAGGETKSAPIDGGAVEDCYEALRIPRQVTLREAPTPSAGSMPVARFKTYGVLPPEVKRSVRVEQRRGLASAMEELAEARRTGDLRREALMVHRVALHQAMAEML